MTTMSIFRISGVSGGTGRTPYIDMPFHLALTGELKYHFPAQIPYVTGQPLNYHWYVYAHIAAASWVTGIDPYLLLERFLGIVVMAVLGVLIVATGRALTGRYWPGLVAITMACVGRGPPGRLGPGHPADGRASTPSGTARRWASAPRSSRPSSSSWSAWCAASSLAGPHLAYPRSSCWPARWLGPSRRSCCCCCGRALRAAGAVAVRRRRSRRRGPIRSSAPWSLDRLLFAQFVVFGGGHAGDGGRLRRSLSRRPRSGVLVLGKTRSTDHDGLMLALFALMATAYALRWPVRSVSRPARSGATGRLAHRRHRPVRHVRGLRVRATWR